MWYTSCSKGSCHYPQWRAATRGAACAAIARLLRAAHRAALATTKTSKRVQSESLGLPAAALAARSAARLGIAPATAWLGTVVEEQSHSRRCHDPNAE
eukprot:2085162-Pyramimonas_sp.AAC.1